MKKIIYWLLGLLCVSLIVLAVVKLNSPTTTINQNSTPSAEEQQPPTPETYTLTVNGDNCSVFVLDSDNHSLVEPLYDGLCDEQLIEGKTYTISIEADAGYEITSITLNGENVDNNSTFTASENVVINATASVLSYTYTVSGENCTYYVHDGLNNEVDVLTHAHNYYVDITCDPGYMFSELIVNGVSQRSLNFTATQNTTIIVVVNQIPPSYSLVSGCEIYGFHIDSVVVVDTETGLEATSLEEFHDYLLCVTTESGYTVARMLDNNNIYYREFGTTEYTVTDYSSGQPTLILDHVQAELEFTYYGTPLSITCTTVPIEN